MALGTRLEDSPTQWTALKEEELKDILIDGTLELNTAGIQVAGSPLASTDLSDTTSLTYNTDTDVSGNTWVLDEDTFTSNSDTKVPTQQSVKAYVDNAVISDTTLSEEEVQDFAWNVLGGTQTLITVTYQDGTNDVDFVVNDDLSLYDNTTSGFITDYTVTETDVTTHEDALSITESQISDLSHFSGDYNDLTNKPDLSALNEVSLYVDLDSFPAIGETDRVYIAADTGYMYRWNGTAYTQLTDQTAIWGQISGTLSDQTDLQSALNGKSDTGHTHTHVDITDFDAEVQALSINNLSEDTAPSLSGTLDAADNDIQNIKLAEFQDEHDNGNSGTSDTIDWGNGNNQKSTLTGNVTYTFTAPSGPSRLQLRIIQDATGSRTVTWPASVKWPSGTAPTLSTAANTEDIVTLFYNGTDYYGVFTGGMA